MLSLKFIWNALKITNTRLVDHQILAYTDPVHGILLLYIGLPLAHASAVGAPYRVYINIPAAPSYVTRLNI